jgi:hypothetical protein
VRAATVPRAPSIGPGRRLIFGIAAASFVAVFAVAAWSFAWPAAAARGEYAVASTGSFEPGSVTTYLIVDGGLLERTAGEDYGPRPAGYPVLGTEIVHIARFPNGEFRVFSGAAPFRDSTIVWYPFDDRGGLLGDWVGFFAEPRRGTRWAIDGTRVFGPAPRGLDTYGFRVRADGVLVIDVADLTQGVGSYELPPPYDVLDPGWPTSGWPSR